MSFELFNPRGESIWMNDATWPKVLTLATNYGWKPAGTFNASTGQPVRPEALREAAFHGITSGYLDKDEVAEKGISGATLHHDKAVMEEVEAHLAGPIQMMLRNKLVCGKNLWAYLVNERQVVRDLDARSLAIGIIEAVSHMVSKEVSPVMQSYLAAAKKDQALGGDGMYSSWLAPETWVKVEDLVSIKPEDWFSGRPGAETLARIGIFVSHGMFAIA
jgi:hypothetical protein